MESSCPSYPHRREDEGRGCSFCAQILEIHRLSPTPENCGRALPAYSACVHIQRVLECLNRQGRPFTEDGRGDIHFFPHGGGSAHWTGHSLHSEAWLKVAQRAGPESWGTSVLVDPQWVSMSTVRSFIDHCVDEHGDRCARPLWFTFMNPAHPEWLIDVTLGCVVPWPTKKDLTYVTLSYTWGQTRTLKLTKSRVAQLRQSGVLREGTLASQIPETIRNAIEITRLLGERYIWVDSLCIIQDDEVSLRRNIGLMPLIYAHSFFCIMAEVGQDAEHGLRGVKGISAARDAGQIVFDLDHGEQLTWNPWIEEFNIDHHSLTYHQRAWTFQEWHFSRRRLIFGRGTVRWLCQCREWREDIALDVDAHMEVTMSDIRGMLLPRTFRKVHTLFVLWDMISQFNQRDLTFAQDVSKAFAGIQTLLHQIYPGGLLFGLPEFYFEVVICWYPIPTQRGIEAARRRARGNTTGKIIVEGLPTWSWMGWHGGVHFFTDGEWDIQRPYLTGPRILEPVTRWFTMETPISSNRRPVNSSWYEWKKKYVGPFSDGIPPPQGWIRDSESGSYAHETQPEVWLPYPIPLVEHEKIPDPNPQTPFLFCQTSRLYFPLNPKTIIMEEGGRLYIVSNHDTVISLVISDQHEVDDLKEKVSKGGSAQIELVAVCKGYVEMALYSSRPSTPDSMGRSGRKWSGPLECYFVLWIDWEDGVAFRKAVGQVLKEVWEDLKEEKLVDLILG